MFLLQRECKAIDDAAEDFKQLCNSVVALRLKDEPIENVVDGLADKGAVDHELAIDAVEDGFQIVPFPRVLAVKQFQQLQDKVLVNMLFGNLSVCVIANHIAEQELIDDLQKGTESGGGGPVSVLTITDTGNETSWKAIPIVQHVKLGRRSPSWRD